jgi:hypothetical protein
MSDPFITYFAICIFAQLQHSNSPYTHTPLQLLNLELRIQN